MQKLTAWVIGQHGLRPQMNDETKGGKPRRRGVGQSRHRVENAEPARRSFVQCVARPGENRSGRARVEEDKLQVEKQGHPSEVWDAQARAEDESHCDCAGDVEYGPDDELWKGVPRVDEVIFKRRVPDSQDESPWLRAMHETSWDGDDYLFMCERKKQGEGRGTVLVLEAYRTPGGGRDHIFWHHTHVQSKDGHSPRYLSVP